MIFLPPVSGRIALARQSKKRHPKTTTRAKSISQKGKPMKSNPAI